MGQSLFMWGTLEVDMKETVKCYFSNFWQTSRINSFFVFIMFNACINLNNRIPSGSLPKSMIHFLYSKIIDQYNISIDAQHYEMFLRY